MIKGKAITGSRCDPSSPLPGGCFITAHDVASGEEQWRVHTIARADDPGGDTWGGLPLSARRHASIWMVGSYDPDLDLVYWGTGVTAPTPETLRGAGKADLLYTNSTLALDPDTGEMAWYFQHLPRDNWDLDHPFERILVETELAPDPAAVPWISPRVRPGERRKVVTGIPGKTGIVWTLDAATGSSSGRGRRSTRTSSPTSTSTRAARPSTRTRRRPRSTSRRSPARTCSAARTSRPACTAPTPAPSTCR